MHAMKAMTICQLLVLGAARCQSPSNKVLRWAISIVWMTPGPNLYRVHWTNKDGSPQDLCEMSFAAALRASKEAVHTSANTMT